VVVLGNLLEVVLTVVAAAVLVVGLLMLAGDRPPPIGSPNHVPLGEPGTVGDWRITVIGVTPDATGEVLAADKANQSPEYGQDFMVALTVTHLGAGTGTFDFRQLTALGPTNITYTSADNGCGTLPPPDLSRQVVTLGTGQSISGNAACWAITVADPYRLTMSVDLGTGPVWFALQ
jgi:hypothetical protein